MLGAGKRVGKDADHRGAAQIRPEHRGRGRHVARGAHRRHAALGAAARARPGAHRQKKQVQAWQERNHVRADALANK